MTGIWRPPLEFQNAKKDWTAPEILKNSSRNFPPPGHFWLRKTLETRARSGPARKYWKSAKKRPSSWSDFGRCDGNFSESGPKVGSAAGAWEGLRGGSSIFGACPAKSGPAGGNFYWYFCKFSAFFAKPSGFPSPPKLFPTFFPDPHQKVLTVRFFLVGKKKIDKRYI